MAELRERDGMTTLLENATHPARMEQLFREVARAWFVGTPTRRIEVGEVIGAIPANMGPIEATVAAVEDLGGGRVQVTVDIPTPPARRR